MTTTAVRPGLLAALSPFTPVGWTSGGTPVYAAQGGRGGGGIQFAVGDDDGADPEFDDEHDDAEDDDEDEPAARGRQRRTTQGDGDDGDEDWTPPDRNSYERLTSALKRANSEAGKRRRVGKVMDRLGISDLDTWLTERGIDPTTGQPYGSDVVDPGDADDEPAGRRADDYEREEDVRPRRDDDERTARQRDRQTARQILTAEQRGRAAARDELMPAMAELAARTAMRDAGFTGTPQQLEKMLRTIDPDTIEFDFDGGSFELVGIEEAIEELRTDFPERFEARTNGRAARRTTANGRATRGAREVDGGDRGRQPRKALGWAEQMVAQMERRGR